MNEFNPMEEPEQCPCCNDHPSWDEIADGFFQCNNCYAVINKEGKVVEEPTQEDDEE